MKIDISYISFISWLYKILRAKVSAKANLIGPHAPFVYAIGHVFTVPRRCVPDNPSAKFVSVPI